MTQWQSCLTANRADPGSLRVISYHDADGSKIDAADGSKIDATDGSKIDAADGSKIDAAMTGGVLKPIDDGTENSRRPEGVTVAQVELALDYADLHWKKEPTTVRCTYFIKLPVGNVTFNNNTAGTAVTRNTCTIGGDPFALSKEEFKEQILIPKGVNGPAKLMPADLGGGSCKLDEEGKARELQDRILQVANESIYHKLCEHVAPGHTTTLHSAVEKIKMSYVDENGNTVSLSVMEYYEAKMRGAIPFAEMETYPYNLATDFVMCLSKSVKDIFDDEDKSYLTLADLSREAQQSHLERYLARAIKCEKKETAVKNVVNSTIGNTHSFYAKVFTALGLPEPSKEAITNDTYLSACEKTLAKYAAEKGDKDSPTKRKFTEADLKATVECWGCGGPHLYKDRQTKQIICPNKDKPGVMARADSKHKAYVEKLKKSKRGYVKRNKVTFSDLSAEEQVNRPVSILLLRRLRSRIRPRPITMLAPSASVSFRSSIQTVMPLFFLSPSTGNCPTSTSCWAASTLQLTSAPWFESWSIAVPVATPATPNSGFLFSRLILMLYRSYSLLRTASSSQSSLVESSPVIQVI
eukprot:scaffold3976_cov45-Cyclotella_meneghiniana.AAC.2